MCATIYYCLTGRLPNAASERVMGDDNVDWRSIPGLTETQIETLEKGLALLPENRLQTMEQLYRGLFEQHQGTSKVSKVQQKPVCSAKEETRRKSAIFLCSWQFWQGIEQWENIIALSASLNHLVGLKDDGSVVAAGRNQDGQCEVSQWRDIVAIACGESHRLV